MDNFLFVGGDFYKIDQNNMKAITTIPGWAEMLNRRGRKTPAASRYTQSPTAYTCVQKRAQALSAVPWDIQTGEDTYAPEQHPLKVLLREVNPEMNWVDLIRATESDLLIYPHAVWRKVGSNNRTYYLERINPPEIKPVVEGGVVVEFERKIGNTVIEKIPREEIIYFHDYSPIDPNSGLSPIDVASRSIDIEIQSSQYMDAFFENNAIPPIIFTTEQVLQDADYSRLSAWIRRTFGGARNQHKAAIMGNGLKAEVIGYPLKDLDLSGVRAEARRDICAALSVPPAIAGAWEAANYASSLEQHRSFYEDTIVPRAEYLASVINAELVPEFGTMEFVWKFDELPIMQEDRLQEAQRVSMLVRDGVITPVVGAVEAGFQEEDAGIGPVQTRIVDQEADIVPGGSNMRDDLNKWQRKAENSLSKGKGAQVDFESEAIPERVNQVVFSSLEQCATKAQVQELFGQFINV